MRHHGHSPEGVGRDVDYGAATAVSKVGVVCCDTIMQCKDWLDAEFPDPLNVGVNVNFYIEYSISPACFTLTCPRHVEGASEVSFYHSVPALRPDIRRRTRELPTPVVH